LPKKSFPQKLDSVPTPASSPAPKNAATFDTFSSQLPECRNDKKKKRRKKRVNEKYNMRRENVLCKRKD
jgi:hypothetical protein